MSKWDRQVTYFIEAKRCGLIKIGTTSGIDARYRCLATQSPDELVLLGLVPAVIGDEVFAEAIQHRALRQYRHHGEWFRATPEVREHIRRQINLASALWADDFFTFMSNQAPARQPGPRACEVVV